MPKYAIAFTGVSNSGKTTLIEKLSNFYFNKNIKVAIIKNDPKDKAIFDKEGKDSDRFFKTKAEVIVTSQNRTTFFSQRKKNLNEIINIFGDFDILLVEGLKNIPLPRILICRNIIYPEYINFSEAIAIDNSIKIDNYNIPKHITILDLNNLIEISEWIKLNSKII